jgi:hypothetical protein
VPRPLSTDRVPSSGHDRDRLLPRHDGRGRTVTCNALWTVEWDDRTLSNRRTRVGYYEDANGVVIWNERLAKLAKGETK